MSGNALAKAADMSQGHLWDLEAGRNRNPSVHGERTAAGGERGGRGRPLRSAKHSHRTVGT